MSIHTFGLATLGRDAELRKTPSGESVTNISLAFNYGRKGPDGKKPTQWVEGALWGNLADAISGYLLKGTQVSVVLSDIHIETFTKSDGSVNSKLVGRVDSIEMARGTGGDQRRGDHDRVLAGTPGANSYAQAKQGNTGGAAKPAAKSNTGFDQMDDDIPFAVSFTEHDIVPLKARRLRHTR